MPIENFFTFHLSPVELLIQTSISHLTVLFFQANYITTLFFELQQFTPVRIADRPMGNTICYFIGCSAIVALIR